MNIRTWLHNESVCLVVDTANGNVITSISEDKFISNFRKYSLINLLLSKSKHGIAFERRAIEKCWKCKERKPITEFNCYGSCEHPCYDCCYENMKKFDLPYELWKEDFDINKVKVRKS